METNKRKFALWMRPESFDLVEKHYKDSNVRSRSAFIEKAVEFYCGYLGSQNYQNYLSNVITSTVHATIYSSEDRILYWMYRLTLEVSLLSHLVGGTLNLDEYDFDSLIKACAKEVNGLVGAGHFEYMLKQLKFEEPDYSDY